MDLNLVHPPADPITPLPPGSGDDSVGFEANGELHHIPDATGDNRRLFEGWVSLVGVDWQDEEMPTSVFEAAIAAYMAKNPVVLWDHKREFPIGRVLKMSAYPDKGIWMRGYIFDERDFDGQGGEIQQKADEVWPLMKKGHTRGLSWSGRARRRWVWSPELGKYIKQPVEVLIHETTVTAIQVHPGAKITGINTLAKALEIAKALPLGASQQDGERTMDEKLQALQAAQETALQALHDLPDGTEIPTNLILAQEKISKALGIEKPAEAPPADPPAEDPISKALEPLMEQLKAQQEQISQLTGAPAPVRNRVDHDDPAGAAPPPSEEGMGGMELISKALEIGGDSVNGVSEKGQGKAHGASGVDIMKLFMITNRHRIECVGKRPQALNPGAPTISLGGQKLLKLAQAQGV